jgi:hypothetical protein
MNMRFLLLVLLIPFEVLGQTKKWQAPANLTRQDPVLVAIRTDALSVADRVIDEMGEVEDLLLRATLAEKIVDLLSKKRPDRCRKMLNAIFDDMMAQKEEASKRNLTPPHWELVVSRVIRAAAVIDLRLSQRYLELLSDSKRDNRKPGAGTSASTSLYLRIATDLIRSNPALAVTVAGRALATEIPPDTLRFLASLREYDIATANRFVLTALQSCQNRGAKDINELLVLYSYVFSPSTVPTVSKQGIGILSIPEYSGLANARESNTALARQYLSVVADTLLDPNRYIQGNIESLALGVEGDFYVILLLEPLVATYLPSKLQTFASQRNTLTSYLQPARREAAFAAADRWKNSPKDPAPGSSTSETTIEHLVARAESTSDPKKKDQFYFRAALMEVRLNRYENALNLVDKISVTHVETARQFIRFDTALQYLKNQQFVEADKLARTDEMLARRAYIITLIADYLVSGQHKDVSRALQYLDEVQVLATKLADERERLSVMIGVGNIYARVDPVRASDILQQAIKHANTVEDFVGNSAIQNVLEIGGFFFDYSIYTNGGTIFDLIKRLSPQSYYSTLHDIRSLKNRALRLRALVELCSAVISDGSQRDPV